ncbi:MAG: hypothetical protein ABIA63_13305, partial [bacterium]
MVEHNCRIWAATEGGVLAFDLNSLSGRGYTPAEGIGGIQIRSVAVDSHGVLWFSSAQGVITSFDGSEWHRYFRFPSLPGQEWNLRKITAYEDFLVVISDSALSFFHTPSGEIILNMSGFGSHKVQDGLVDVLVVKDTFCIDTSGVLHMDAHVMVDAVNDTILNILALDDTITEKRISESFPLFQCEDTAVFPGDTIIAGVIHLLGRNFYATLPLCWG